MTFALELYEAGILTDQDMPGMPSDNEGREECEIVDWQELMHYIDDATGICAGVSSFTSKSPYHNT